MGDEDYPGIYICINNTYYNTLGNVYGTFNIF